MTQRKKNEGEMTTITLNELEKRVKGNSNTYKDKVTKFQQKTTSKKMRLGRVRPKHPTEAKILAMFDKKNRNYEN